MSIFFLQKMQRFLSFLLRRVMKQILYNMGPKLLKLQTIAAGVPPPQEETNTTVWMFSLSLGTLAEIASPASLLRRGKAATG